MKKIFIPFCALALFSTQLLAVQAAPVVSEKAKNESVQIDAKVFDSNQYDDIFLEGIGKLTNVHGKDTDQFNKKLAITKKTLERILKINLDQVVQIAVQTIQEQQKAAEQTIETANNDSKIVEQENVVVNTQKATESTTQKTNETTNKPVQKNSESTKQNNNYQAPSKPTNNQQQTNTNQEQVVKPATPSVPNTAISEFERQVVDLTNAERTKAGLAPLEMYSPLMDVAEAKSADMASNNYFSHTSPTYGSPFDQIKAAGINYRAAGENIAQGQRTPQQVVQAWMQSPGHRQNILNANYTHIGVGFVEDGYYWTQQFIQL